MDVKSVLAEGLQMEPRRLPVWFRYDKHGSLYNDKFLTENQYYFFYRSEVAVLSSNIREIVDTVASPYVLVEMGSGNSEKTRRVIDVILQKQTTLTYVPIDISAEFLRETSEALSRDYGASLDVKPVPGDYSFGIEQIRTVPGRKLILWMGGGFQNQAYQTQIARLDSLAQSMTGDDRLLVAVDVTQDPEVVEKAYLDPAGTGDALYLNALWRLNRDYGSQIDTNNFRLDARFVHGVEDYTVSGVIMEAVSKKPQTIEIPGLSLSLELKAGDKLRLHEGEYISCKYTEAQIRHVAGSSGLVLNRIWTDANKHVALCCFAKAPARTQTS